MDDAWVMDNPDRAVSELIRLSEENEKLGRTIHEDAALVAQLRAELAQACREKSRARNGWERWTGEYWLLVDRVRRGVADPDNEFGRKIRQQSLDLTNQLARWRIGPLLRAMARRYKQAVKERDVFERAAWEAGEKIAELESSLHQAHEWLDRAADRYEALLASKNGHTD